MECGANRYYLNHCYNENYYHFCKSSTGMLCIIHDSDGRMGGSYRGKVIDIEQVSCWAFDQLNKRLLLCSEIQKDSTNNSSNNEVNFIELKVYKVTQPHYTEDWILETKVRFEILNIQQVLKKKAKKKAKEIKLFSEKKTKKRKSTI